MANRNTLLSDYLKQKKNDKAEADPEGSVSRKRSSLLQDYLSQGQEATEEPLREAVYEKSLSERLANPSYRSSSATLTAKSLGETQRSSRVNIPESEITSGKTWEKSNQRVTASVRSAEDIRKDISDLDREIEKKSGNGIWTGAGLVGGSQPNDQKQQVASLKAARERLRQEYNAATRLPDASEVSVPQNYTRNMPVTMPEGMRRAEYWASIPDYTDLTANLSELETKKQELTDSLNRSTRDLRVERQRLLSQKGNSSEKQSRLAEIDEKLKEAEEKTGISALEQQIAEAQSLLPASYAKLQRSADFEENGAFDEGFAKLSKDDMYSLVNNPTEENNLLRNTYTQGDVRPSEGVQAFADVVTGTVFNDPTFIRNMTDDERKTYNYIYKKSGKEAAEKYLATIESGLTTRYREQIEEQSKKFAKEHPVAASALTVAASPLKAVGYVGQVADYAASGKIDQNSPRNAAAYSSTAVRGEVAENIDESITRKVGEVWGSVGSNAYQIGMSMADFAFNTLASGGTAPLASFIMGSSAAADTTIRAKDRGLKDNQAFALGFISGATELLTEKYSIDTLLEKSGMGKKAFTYWLKNVIGEGSEETTSEFVNIVADIMIAGDKSEWNQSIATYKKNGMSEQDAFWATFADNAINLGVSFIGGAVSGGTLAALKLGGDVIDRKVTHSGGQVHREIYDADTANKTEKLSAVNDALEAAKSARIDDTAEMTKTSAEFVRTVRDARPDTKNVINTAIDYVREEISVYNDLIKDTKDSKKKSEYVVERTALINVDRTLRSYRAEVDAILANLPAQTETQTAPQTEAEAENTNRTIGESETTVGETAPAVGATNPETETIPAPGTSGTSAQPVSEAETETEQTVIEEANASETLSTSSSENARNTTANPDIANRIIAFDFGFAEDFGTPEEAAEQLVSSGYTFEDIRKKIKEYSKENTPESSAVAERLTEIHRVLAEKNRPEIQKIANTYAPQLKTFGISNVVVEDMPAGRNGYFDRKDNSIHLSTGLDGEKAVGRLIVHEFTHNGAKIDMSLADSIVSVMESRKGGRGYVSEAVIREAYADQLSGLTAEEADSIVREERAAHFMERIMEDVNVLDEFRDDRTFLRKILDAIRDFFARNNPDKQEQIRLRNIEKKINDLLKAANVDAEVKTDRDAMQSGNAGMRFSLDTPVEEAGELIAVHNLSEEKLKKVFDLGGFPMPSVAIVRAQDGHEGFGDISVVFGKEVIDPKGSKSNKVYSADAWTPTYPTVEYKASEDAEQRITQKYNDLRSRFGDDARPLRRYTGDLSDELTRNGGVEGIIEHLQNDTDMMQLYLLDNGKDKVKPVEKETETVMSEDEQAMYQGFIDQIGEDAVRAVKAPDGEKPIEYRRKYISDHLEEIKNAYKGMLMEVFEYTSAEADSELETRKNSDYAPFMVRAEKFLRNGPKTVKTETDYAASKQAILDAVDMDGYTEWLEGLFNGAVEKTGLRNKQERFTASGKRRSWDALHYENTLENVVKAMKDSGEKGLGVFGNGNIFGAATREYKSVDDIKKDASKRLRKVSQEEYADMKQEFQDRLFEIAKRLAKNSDYRAMDDAMDILVEAVSKNKTPAKIDAYIKSESEGYANYSPEITADLLALVEDIRSMPTAYFEAKPQRAVSVSEIGAFVVPSDIKDSTRKLLDSTSAQVVEYERGDTESRLNALNLLNDLRFSRELGEETRWSESPEFSSDIDVWVKSGMPGGESFVLGITGDVLQGLGAIENEIYINGDKIKAILEKHPEMTVREIKKIPQILKNPVLILRSNNDSSGRQNTRLVIFGSVKAQDGRNILTALDLRPREGDLVIDDMQKVTSSYTKDTNPEDFVRRSKIVYADKKGTARLLRSLGFKMPIELLRDGYIGSISYNGQSVNISGEDFDEIFAETPGIRYSRDIETPEQRHTRLMEENNEYLKKQFRAQTAFGWAKTVSPAQRNKFAGTIAADIPGVSAAEVSAAIKPVYDLFEKPKRGAKDTPEVRFEEARKAAVEAAERLVDGAIQTEVNPLYEQYNDLRNFLRTTPIKRNVSVEEFGGAEAYSKWRNGNKGLIRVSDDPSARTIDQVYKEISEQYPEFFPEDITDLSEMLRRMGDVAVMLKAEAGNKTVRVNPLEDVRDSFVQDVASRILFGFDELARITPAAKYEYSAKVNERDVQQAYAEGSRDASVREAQAYESGVKEGRRQNDREVQAARQREDIQYQIFQRDFKQAVNNFNLEIERQNKRIDALQTRIEKRGQQEQLAMAKKVVYGRLNRLNTMLTKPTRSKHIPQNLRAPVAKLLETIGTTRLPNGKTVSAETMRDIQEKEYARFEAESVRAADELETIIGANPSSGDNAVTKQFLDKLQENVRRLKEMYADINPNSPDDAVLPPDLAATKQIEYVKQLNKILAMTESYIKDSDTVFFAGKAVSAKEFSERMISDLRGKTVPNETNHLRKFIHDVGYEFVSADLFFEMIGETGDEIMRQYRKAQTTQAKCEEEYAQYVLEKTGGKYSTNKAGYNGEKIDITVDGKNIKATRAQLMQLYMTWKRPAGRRHLRSGGAIFVNEAGVELSENTVLINDKTYNELVSYLTDEDKRIADALGSFMVRRCAEWGNDASMKMYGYRMFEDPNYFPMDVSNNVLPANWDSMDEFYRLENAGMTKSLKENAFAPLRMTDIFNVADFHVRTMAAYTAYAPVSNDVQRILSMPGVNEAVNVGMGKKGAKYLETLVKTIASNKVRTGDMSDAARPLQFFMNAYKRQAVSFNISTALKQPLSIIRALNEIDAKYIAKVPLNISGSDYKRAYNAMIENSGVAKMKMLGYSDTGFGKSLRQIYDEGYINESGVIRGSFSKTKAGRVSVKVYDKITDAGMWAAGKMDEMTWVRLWRACELEVADRYKGLSAKEKTAKVAERFNEIIGRSQVVDTVLDTSPLMRNNAMALLTPFMNEPTKALATMITAADAWRDGKPNGKKKLAKAIGLVALNNLLLEPIVSSLMTMWRDEEDDTENIADFSKKFLKLYAGVDLDGETSVSSVITSVMTSNAVSGIFGFPIIQIFYNTFSDSMQNYGNEKIDTAALSNLVRDTKNLIVNIQKAPVDRVETNYKLFGDFLGSAAAAIGVPLPTLRRQVSAMGRTILEHTDNYEAQWDYARFLYNLENGSARTQKQFYNIMAAAYKAGDVEAYRYMLNDLKNTQTGKKTIGVSWNKMKKYIEDRGGEYEIGSDLWLVSIQAEFNLPSFNPSMKVESSIAKIYKNALAEKVKNPGRALPSTPALYSYNKVDEDGNDILDENGDPVKVEMTLAEYEDFIADVGRLSYNILLALQGQGQFKNLSAEEQVYCLDKAYDFAARYYRSKFNPDYNLSSGGKWMAEVAKGNLDTTKISRAILKAERNRD